MDSNCSQCYTKFTLHDAIPRILSCNAVACSRCITDGVKAGYLSCKNAECGKEHGLSSVADAPVDKRNLGHLVCPKSIKSQEIGDEAQVNFQDVNSGPLDKCFLTICKEHIGENLVITPSPSMQTRCLKCLSVKDDCVKVVPIKNLNNALLGSSLVQSSQSNCRTQAIAASKHLLKIEANDTINHLKVQKNKVKAFFDGIHRSLELRENEVLLKIKDKEDRIKGMKADIEKIVSNLELLNEAIVNAKNGSSSKLAAQPNLFEVIKSIDGEFQKLKEILKRVNEELIPLEISTDDKFLNVLRSAVMVGEPSPDTPPDSEDDRKSDVKEECSELLNQLYDIVDDNVEIVEIETENPVTRSDKLLMTLDKLKTSSKKKEPINDGIINIVDDSDTEDEDSSSDITIEDVDEANLGFVPVPKFKVIECEVLSVVDPSRIWLRRSEDKSKLGKLTSELSCSYNKLVQNSQGIDKKWKEGSFCVMKFLDYGWSRARIEKVKDDGVDVFLLDHGVTLQDVSSSLYPLEGQFFTPSLSFPISLSDILPLGNGNKWSKEATVRLNQLVQTGNHLVEIEALEKPQEDGTIPAAATVTVQYNSDPMEPTKETVFDLSYVLIEDGLGISPKSHQKALEQIKFSVNERKFPRWIQPTPITAQTFKCRVQWLDYYCVFHVSPTDWDKQRKFVAEEVQAKYLRVTDSFISKSTSWRKGQAVIAVYPTDSVWYRAEILESQDDSEKVSVKFVDFGTDAIIEKSHVCDKLVCQDIPILSFPVKLDVEPITKTWEVSTLDQIHQIAEEGCWETEVKFYGNPYPFIVRMTRVRNGEDVDLEKLLIEKGLVKKGFRER